MKFTHAFAAAALILMFTSCSKENSVNTLKTTGTSNLKNATETSIPLNDLGTGTYMGSVGGLYPGGVNSPSGQYAADLLATSNTIIPIDKLGNPSTSGKVVFISIGASIGGHNMRELKTKTKNNPATNPKLLLLNCNNGSGEASLNSIMNPIDPYWDHVNQVIVANSSYKQVQVIYLETDDSSAYVHWPEKPTAVKNDLEACLRVFKQKFENIKVVYVLGRTRTFGNQRPWNREPGPYYFGWGCKWAIEDQINGVAGTEYKDSGAVAPMITWGWYQWADVYPRTTDGFKWLATETSDGLHANDRGQDTLATHFQNFLLTDPNASIWYAAH